MESAEEAGLGRWAGNRIMRTEYGYNHTGSMTGTRARGPPQPIRNAEYAHRN